MNERYQTQLVFHGAVILFASMVVGVPFGSAITDGWGDEAVRAWRVAHSALAGGATLILAIAAVGHRLAFSERAAGLLVWSLVVGIYALGFALVFGRPSR